MRFSAISSRVKSCVSSSTLEGSLARANALVVLRPGSGRVEKEGMVQALMMGGVFGGE